MHNWQINSNFWLLNSSLVMRLYNQIFLKLPLLVIAFQDMKDAMILSPMKTTLQAKEGKNV
jgi:hypothetical protein